MPISTFYHTWIRRIQDLRPGQRITPVRNFAWQVVDGTQAGCGYNC